jgi:rubrerythrin
VELTERELRTLANAADEHHRDAMRTFDEDVRALHNDAVDRGRRRFLGGAVTGGAALALAPTLRGRRWFRSASAQEMTDEDLAAFAQSVELAAVAAYGQAAGVLSAATKPVATLFQGHHQEHADAFGALAGAQAVDGPNEKLVAALTPALQAVKDETGALELAFGLENQAAETYAFGLTAAASTEAASGMATILPIESEHAAVLGAALGKPLGDVFVNGAFESAAVGDGTDITKGIDPAQFPV